MKKTKSEIDHKKVSSDLTKEIFLFVFLVLSVFLALTLLFYYKLNSSIEEEITFTRDILQLRTKIQAHKYSKIKGYLEVSETFDGVNVIGKIDGLHPGSSHAVHILEFSDIATGLPLSKQSLKHFNPSHTVHSCPTGEDDSSFHLGDFGNIIANNEGSAVVSITKKISLKALNGRAIVITKTPDKCDENQEYDEESDILGYGLLNVIKPSLLGKVDFKNDYFLKELNAANKKDFEKKNRILQNNSQSENKINQKKEHEKISVSKSKNHELPSGSVINFGNFGNLLNPTTTPLSERSYNLVNTKPDAEVKNLPHFKKINSKKDTDDFSFSNTARIVPARKDLSPSHDGKILETPFIRPSSLNSDSHRQNFLPKGHIKHNHVNYKFPTNINDNPNDSNNKQFFMNTKNFNLKPKSSHKNSLNENFPITHSVKKDPIDYESILNDLVKDEKTFENNYESKLSRPNEEISEIPGFSLAQLSKDEKDPLILNKNNNGTPKHSNDFSFMSTNIEPIVNNLMSNQTTTNLLKEVDASLLNPYRDLGLNENESEEKIKSKDNSQQKKSEYLSFSRKLDKLQSQLKNETLKELKDLKDPLIELPGIKHNSEIKNKKKESHHHLPIIDDFASNFKLFNFKENQSDVSSPHSIFDKLNSELLKIKPEEKVSDKPQSESVNKMLENFSNQGRWVKRMKSKHDKNHLFLDNLKNNIPLIEDYTKKHFNH